MSISKKVFIIGIVCFLLIVIVGVSFLYLTKKDSILDLIFTKKGSPASGEFSKTGSGQTEGVPIFFEHDIPLPKSKVNSDYYIAFNQTVNEIVLIEITVKGELDPLIEDAKAKFETQSYIDYLKIVFKIKDINKKVKGYLVFTTDYLNNLSLINKNISDRETQNLTADFITQGQKLVKTFSAYAAIVGEATSWGKPSEQIITETQFITKNLNESLVTFDASLKPLLTFFDKTTKDDFTTAQKKNQ